MRQPRTFVENAIAEGELLLLRVRTPTSTSPKRRYGQSPCCITKCEAGAERPFYRTSGKPKARLCPDHQRWAEKKGWKPDYEGEW